VKYHFTKPYTAWVCTTISDTNSNTITISYHSNNSVYHVTDPGGRQLTFSYYSNHLAAIDDPLERTWVLNYTQNGNDDKWDLTSIDLPAVTEDSTPTAHSVYYEYDVSDHHNIATYTDTRGKDWTFTYNNADDSCASQADPYENEVGYVYDDPTTTITDPNGHETIHTYTDGLLTQDMDPLEYHEDYEYDADNNVIEVTDKRGNIWSYPDYDANGNCETAITPYPLEKTTTYTYNGHSKMTSKTNPLGDYVVWTYDGNDNCTDIDWYDDEDTLQAHVEFDYPNVNNRGLPDTKTDDNNQYDHLHLGCRHR